MAAGRSPWGGGAVAVTDRGILRRAIEHLSIAAAGRYDREGPQVWFHVSAQADIRSI